MQLDPKALRSALDAYHASLPTHDYPSRWAMEEAITAYRLALPQEPSSASVGVVEALRQLTYERAKNAYGYEIADALAGNGWRWPDTAPDFIDTSLYRAVAALSALSQPAKGEGEGGGL